MKIRLTGLSLVMGALFALPSAMATSPAADTSIRQGGASYLVLAEAQQQQQEQHQHQQRQGQRGGEGGGQGYANNAGEGSHAGHGGGGQGGQGQDGKQCKGKDSGGGEHAGHGDKGKHGHGHGYAHSIAMQADALGLSDEQLGKIVRLHLKEDKQAHERIKEKMKASMKAFREAVSQPATDDETLRKLGQAHVDVFNEMVNYHIQERKTVRSILTPEQIGKLKGITTGHEH